MKNMISSFKFAALLAACLVFPPASWAQDAEDLQDTPPSKEQLIEIYQNQNWQGVVDMAEQLMQIDPEDSAILSIYGVALAQLDKNEQAEGIFLKLIEKSPDDAQVLGNLCYAQSSLKRENALETCIKAAELNPDKDKIQYMVGQMLETANRPQDARDYYLKAWNIDKKSPIYLTAATSIDFRLNESDKAYEHTKTALDSGLKMPILYLNIELASNNIGTYEETIRLADEGYEAFHDDMMRMHKAVALYKLGRLDEAEALLKELDEVTAEGNFNYPRLQYTYGQVLLAKGCSAQKAGTCQTPNEDVCCVNERNALERINKVKDHELLKKETLLPVYLGFAQLVNGEGKNAEALLSKSLDAKNDKEDILAALAVTLYQFGDDQDKKAGMNYLSQALEISKDFEDIQKVKSSRLWPERTLEILGKMLDERNEAAKPKKSGCSCDIAGHQGAPLSLASIFAVLAMLLSGLWLRRRTNKQ